MEKDLKQAIVDYVGESLNLPQESEIDVEKILEVMIKEFPEFVLAIAEENFLRGYEQALLDTKGILEQHATPDSQE